MTRSPTEAGLLFFLGLDLLLLLGDRLAGETIFSSLTARRIMSKSAGVLLAISCSREAMAIISCRTTGLIDPREFKALQSLAAQVGFSIVHPSASAQSVPGLHKAD
jgi:hypothetical protein